jgi:hypothetical protein
MFSKKRISTAATSGFAALSLWVLPSAAQEIPSPRAETLAPQAAARPPVTVKCPSGHSYRLTTGSDGGVCKIYVDHGKVTGGFCTDGTNSALQTCATGCKEITGSGACDKHDPTAPNDATVNQGD